MEEYQFGSVTVKVIDKSSHEDRKQRLIKPLSNFFKEVEREKHEKKTKAVN